VLRPATALPVVVREQLRLLLARGHECRADVSVAADARRKLVDEGPQAVEALETLPVLAAAIRLGCDARVTGGRRHFASSSGQGIKGVHIHLPRSLAEAVLA
jgi:hypothetical protein